MLSNNYYLHFATDLRRAVFCLTNDNIDGTITFLAHAKDLYHKKLQDETINKLLSSSFENTWLSLISQPIPTDAVKKGQFAEELLTLSSLVFYRVTAQLQKMDGPLSSYESDLEAPTVPTPDVLAQIPQKIKI